MIKYECELCGATVVTEEAIGQDVYLNDVRGKAFQWQAPTGEILTITYEMSWTDHDETPAQQFCYGCMFRTIKELLAERFPPSNDAMVARKLTEFLGPFAGPAADFERPNSLPEGDLYVQAHRASIDPAEDRRLQELYTQGQLQEPGPYVTAETPIAICSCERRGRDGVIIWQNPGCPVHSPGGSPGASRGPSD